MPIVWPEHYAPDRVAARVSNEITISAPPATVWAWLVRASLWPTWYPNSDQVQIAGGARDLSAGLDSNGGPSASASALPCVNLSLIRASLGTEKVRFSMFITPG